MTRAARTPAAALTRPVLVSRRMATRQRCQTRTDPRILTRPRLRTRSMPDADANTTNATNATNATATAETVRLPDGRRLGVAYHGDPTGSPVFVCHGTPASRLGHEFTDEA